MSRSLADVIPEWQRLANAQALAASRPGYALDFLVLAIGPRVLCTVTTVIRRIAPRETRAQ